MAAAGGPRCGCVGRRAAAAGGRVPTLAVHGARARAPAWCRVPGLRRRPGRYAWVHLCLRAAVGRVCSRHAHAPACPCPVCSWLRHARRACGRVCRVLVRYVCAQVRPVPPGASKRTMPASRAVKPGCCKNLGRGFPELLPKTALCAGYLSQGKASSLRFASRRPPRAPHSHYAVLPAARASFMHVCMLPPCTMCCCAVRHRGLRALAVRMCREGRWRGVAGRGHATFVTTRPGVCPLAQASATARLHWPLTRHTGTARQRDAPSFCTCAHLPHTHAIALNTLL